MAIIPHGKYVLKRKTVFVCITRALAGRDPSISSVTPIEGMACGFWFAKDQKIRQCELLVAVSKNIIRGVWEIDTARGWNPMAVGAIPLVTHSPSEINPRRRFCRFKGGTPAESVLVGHDISCIKGMDRMYGPIRYNF